MYVRKSILIGVLLILLLGCTEQSDSGTREVDAEAVFASDEESGDLEVRFFHLDPPDGTEKTGISSLIITPKGKTLLIDAGIPAVGPLVDEYLNDLDVETIDYAIASHPHQDHIGGYLTLLETKEIGQVLETDFPYDSDVYLQYQELISNNNIDVTYPEKGDVIEIEKDLTLEVLSPDQNTIENYLDIFDDFSAGVVNDLSLVLKLTYKDRSFLFPGDIYKGVESQLVDTFGDDLAADVLVAPHHGQHTSSSEKFIDAVNPEISVIPINLLYSKPTYDDYLEFSEVYVSQFHGNVLLVSDGKKIDIYTEMEHAEEVSN
ncbi:competence protein ComEC [Oceanobacillus limi]|uniref:Competence protein ComEC n=1 Tax=Oceanobacillus limi TaxID=930131 RepID=A0A1I0A4E8_9BACI|nr:MBL fold metallo-hydrolase [Oceanobacillus limi]SES88951.1 competence protein ComEC [Oceanobacillus limi]